MEPLVKELLERHKEDRDLTDPKVQQEVKRLREKYNRVDKELDDDEQLVGLDWSKANLKEWNLKEIELSSSKYHGVPIGIPEIVPHGEYYIYLLFSGDNFKPYTLNFHINKPNNNNPNDIELDLVNTSH